MVKEMATRQQKLGFAIKRFKGFWNVFKKSKSGIVGLIIIIIFCLAAVFAPLIASWDPIYPMYGVGEYPALGASRGIPIAAMLAKPIWYKYLVPLGIIRTGLSNLTENFYNVVAVYTTGSSTTKVQLFGREGDANATYDGLFLQNRVTTIVKVETVENDVSTTLANGIQYYINASEPRMIRIVDYYASGTIFKVTYTTGADLVENIQVVKEHMLNTPDSFNAWNWETNDTTDSVSVGYNSEKGFVFSSTENRGCIGITYTGDGSSKNGSVAIRLLTNFTYPYNQPPETFTMFASVSFEGLNQTEIIPIHFLLYNENKSFTITKVEQEGNQSYTHYAAYSADPQAKKYVGVNPPQDGIFVSKGNYKYAVEIVLPKNILNSHQTGTIKIYLDDVDCWLYGNIFGLLGTDNAIPYPRDLFSSLVYGTRVSLIVGILSAVFSTLIGLFLGLVSGYVGGIVDEGIMRFADLLLVLPTLPLFIILIVALRKVAGMVSMWNIIIILTLLGWMGFARSVRSMVLSIRERAFIEAAKASGAGKLHIINRHIIPNVFALVYITLATSVPGAIITEASLSWLGLGDPMIPSWGKTLYDFNVSSIATSKGLTEYWFWIFPACIAIALLATAFILVGYALDEILNPRLRERR
jgi:ABC-type dipeptide/oligopeptide/nickel transport system permease subunit